MDSTAIVLLIVSCCISFGLGRLIVRHRNKKRFLEAQQQARQRQAQAALDRANEPASKNRAKRKRQLQEARQQARTGLENRQD